MTPRVQIITDEASSPTQLAAWRWLWALLLAPEAGKMNASGVLAPGGGKWVRGDQGRA